MLEYTHKDNRKENTYKYSPFRNVGPQQPYEEMDYNERRQEDNRRKLEGQIFHTKQGYDIEIVDYMTVHNVIVRFLCDGYLKLTTMNTIRKGLVWYPFERNKFGGYAGDGPYNQGNSKKANSIWYNMLQRTNPESWSQIKYSRYKNTIICPDWYNFQNFAVWYYWQLSFLNPDIDRYEYQIDKDILQWGLEQKVYGPNTCLLIPRKLNAALEFKEIKRIYNLPKGVDYYGPNRYCARCSFGSENSNGIYLGTFKSAEEAFQVYKKEKETYLRNLVDQYLLEGAILPKTRDAIYNIDIKPYGI